MVIVSREVILGDTVVELGFLVAKLLGITLKPKLADEQTNLRTLIAVLDFTMSYNKNREVNIDRAQG